MNEDPKRRRRTTSCHNLAALVLTLAALTGGCRKVTSEAVLSKDAEATIGAPSSESAIVVEDAAVLLELAGGGASTPSTVEPGRADAGFESTPAGSGRAAADGHPAEGGAPAPSTVEPGRSDAGFESTPPTGSGRAAADPHPTEGGPPAGFVDFEKIDSPILPVESVNALLKKNRDLYRSCYGKALHAQSRTAGTVRLKVVVLATGAVERVDVVGGSLAPSPLIQCSVAKTRLIRFAPTATTLEYDVGFSPTPH